MVDWMRIYDAPDEYLYDGEQLSSSPHYRTVAKAGTAAPLPEPMTFQLEDGAAELLSIAHEVRTGGYTNRTLLAERLEAIAGRNRAALSSREGSSDPQ